MIKKTRNPTDATLRNVRAAQKALKALRVRVQQLTTRVRRLEQSR